MTVSTGGKSLPTTLTTATSRVRPVFALPLPGPCGCVRCFMRAMQLEQALRGDPRFGIGGAA